MVAHVYDTTYEVIRKGTDTLVVIDDSIVRGTTLEKSILKMLDRLGPKKIVIVSSAPQIRYPDCYGIDMSRLKDFVAFRAMIELVKDKGKEDLLTEVYERCIRSKDDLNQPNHAQSLYGLFTDEEVSKKISEIVRPKGMQADLEVVFQTVENLHKAIPNHSGDWYFTGNYPTPGGMRISNRAFANYMDGKLVRAY
jgi:amidophosphoribosyltransferase